MAQRFLRLALAAAATVTVLAPVSPARAAANSQTSFAPTSAKTSARTFFHYTVDPGATLVDSAVLTNLTYQPQTYVLYAADAGDVNGAFAIAGQQVRPSAVGAWVALEVHRVVLGPHGSRTIRLQVTVPPNATPGDHAGGVVALAVGGSPVDSRRSLEVRALFGVGIRVYAHVTGRLSPRLSVARLSLTPSGGLLGSLVGRDEASVTYRVSNVGNTRLTPSASAVVSTVGKSVALPSQPMGELLPGSSAERVVAARGLRWTSLLGVMRARVTVMGGAGAPPVDAEVTVLTVPWLLIALLTAAAGSALSLWWARRPRGDEGGGAGPDEPPAPGDDTDAQLVGV